MPQITKLAGQAGWEPRSQSWSPRKGVGRDTALEGSWGREDSRDVRLREKKVGKVKWEGGEKERGGKVVTGEGRKGGKREGRRGSKQKKKKQKKEDMRKKAEEKMSWSTQHPGSQAWAPRGLEGRPGSQPRLQSGSTVGFCQDLLGPAVPLSSKGIKNKLLRAST